MDSLVAVLGAFVSALLGAFAFIARDVLQVFLSPLGIRLQRSLPPNVPADRLTSTLDQLRSSAQDANLLLEELEQDVSKRAPAVSDLQGKLIVLERQEHEANQRLERLQQVEPQTARDFRALVDESLASNERSGRVRDYALFCAGVIVSAVFFWLGLTLTGN